MVLTLRLPGDVTAPGAARRALRPALTGRIETGMLEDVLLVVSELVANAVLHGGVAGDDAVEVRARLGPSALCVKVFDAGPGFDATAARRAAATSSVGGRGLRIVERLALDWGRAQVDGRTEVWAELSR